MVLVIGYGNTLRRDDGAGVALAEQMARARGHWGGDVRFLTAHQLTPEMAEEVAAQGVSAVVFLDAAAAGPEAASSAARLRPISVDSPGQGTGHHLCPDAVMAYAYFLYGRRVPAWMLTVPGTDFGHGEGLSRGARRALAGAEQALRGLLARLSCAHGGDTH